MKIQNEQLIAALQAAKPSLIDAFKSIITRQFAAIVAEHGEGCKNAANGRFAKLWCYTIRAYVTAVTVPGDLTGAKTTYVLNDEQIAAGGTKYAEACIEAWILKIHSKLGELDTATTLRLDGDTFLIHGTRGGKRIEIEQTRILNVSSKGTLFNQFPARIYLDGKSISEAKYAKAFAA